MVNEKAAPVLPFFDAPRPVLQDWAMRCSFMQQTVMLTAVRGPDGISKYNHVKFLIRWYRRCLLVSSLDGIVLENPYDPRGGSFMGPSYKSTIEHNWQSMMHEQVGLYLQELDALPHHAHMHFMHAVEIMGYKHSDIVIRCFWYKVYERFVNDMHLHTESEEELDLRLSDNRDNWLARNDVATVD